jgi:hypothetical protein|tara:strand:+ start:237 stop:455 length:219 start_codon:yes stop_codon:yes gene_type:complete
MQKTYFYNNKFFSENKDKKKIVSSHHIKSKINVDINKLLNRVKIEKKNENKKKVIFYSSIISMLCAFIYIIV